MSNVNVLQKHNNNKKKNNKTIETDNITHNKVKNKHNSGNILNHFIDFFKNVISGKEDEIKHQISVIDAVKGGCVGGFAQESNFINSHKKYQDRGIEQRLVDDCPKPRTLVLRESVFEDFFVYIFQEVNHFALSDAG